MKKKLIIICSCFYVFLLGAVEPDRTPIYQCEDSLKTSDPAVVSLTQGEFRDIEKMESLSVMSFNLLNLFVHMGKFMRQPELFNENEIASVDAQLKMGGGLNRLFSWFAKMTQNFRPADKNSKPKKFLEWIARIILTDENPDIILVQEIETKGKAARQLQKFNKEFLGDKYIALEFPGNDPRIKVGVLLKKDLPFDYYIETHRHHQWHEPGASRPRKVMSRDFPVISLRPKGANNEKSGAAFLNMAVTHNKSKRSRNGDPESRKIAFQQFLLMAQVMAELERPGPQLIGGDFNRNFIDPADLKILAPLVDPEDPKWAVATKDSAGALTEGRFFDPLENQGLEDEERWTYAFFPFRNDPIYSELDTVLLDKGNEGLVSSARIHAYADAEGDPLPSPPATKAERNLQPSDHRPVIVDLDMAGLRKLWKNRAK